MARKKTRRTTSHGSARKPASFWLLGIFGLVIIVQSVWLLAFIFSTGTLLPSNLRLWVSGNPDTAWGPAQEQHLQRTSEELDNLRLQKLLAEQGSRGPENPEDLEPVMP